MSEQGYMNFVYLSVLILFFILRFATQPVSQWMHNLRMLSAWGIIAVLLLLAYSFADELKMRLNRELFPSDIIAMGDELWIKKNANGHFHIKILVNGKEVEFLVDTGATGVLLSREDAGRVGLNVEALEYVYRTETANGIALVAKANADLAIGSIILRDMSVSVSKVDGTSLLGMSILGRFGSIRIEGDDLYLK